MGWLTLILTNVTCSYVWQYFAVNENCINNNGNCSSLCIPTPTGYVCACGDGIEMKDKYTCSKGMLT